MSCSNCYNGCPQIISDQCVKYTGIDIPVLGIKKGDSLSYVEQAIITFLTSTLDGTGIKPNIDQAIICQIVSKNLPTCGDLTVVDFIKALVQAVCELKTIVDGTVADIDDINDFITSLESAYDVGCLTGVAFTSGTHDILQAVIDRLCAFIIDVEATYVKLDDLDSLIAAYLAGTTAATKYYTRMVPYMAVPFFPTPAILSNFSGSGVGSGDWEKIYFCNGANGTPDLRGRVPVGVTSGMGGATLSPVVSPGGLNPDYQLGTNTGANGITLSESQMPRHTHEAISVVSPNPHNHSYSKPKLKDNADNSGVPDYVDQESANTSDVTLTVETILNEKGNNEAHSNVQPGIGCYYIMYIP
jgi:microcystin-dependent protein